MVRGTKQTPRQRTPPQEADSALQTKPVATVAKKKAIKTVFDFMESKLLAFCGVYCHMCYLTPEAEPGPFSLLQQCRSHKQRVRVTLRHCAGVRGVCEGVVIVYDRHLNIVLGQVVEWYTPLRTVANGGITESRNKRRKKKKSEQIKDEQTGGDTMAAKASPESAGTPLEVHPEGICPQGSGGMDSHKWESRRTVSQLFIRGDNVIHVSRTPDHPTSCPI